MTLVDLLPDLEDVPESLHDDAIFDSFVSWTRERGVELYPAQEEAVMEIVDGSNVVLATPTGSGKSLVAIGAHFASMARHRRTFYTAPIKALVSEKFFDLCGIFGPDNVGMMTGDAAVNPDAPIICATAEIVANLALREGAGSDIGQVVMDEFHYYSEPDRGWAWQVPLLELPHAQFLLMSATLGDVSFLRRDLTRRTGRATALVAGSERPVPLSFRYVRTAVHETIEELVAAGDSPVYVVHFTQAAALERAQSLTSVNLCDRERRDRIADEIGTFRFSTAFGRVLSRLLRAGIGVHHAGMLPKYRRLVERLAQEGLLTVICGTDTLGVGINVPIHTVLFTGLAKFDGRRQRHLKAREFHQIAGRAGRAGFDTEGLVVVQAPEHEVENAKLEERAAKAAASGKKRKVQRKKPPEGFVSWTEATFDRLSTAEPERMTSQFDVTNSMLLNVIARPGSCFESMRHLLRDNHETRRRQNQLIRRAIELFRGLETSGIVERRDGPDEHGRHVALTLDLQRDFALNQPLSPFAVACMELLDRDSPTYAVDVVSLVECTLDDPRPLLMAQQHAARGEEIARLKADGVEYEERMEAIEDVTWPKPLGELIEDAYETFRGGHAWVSEFEPKPKSVVREMIEKAMTFSDLVSVYNVGRSEGLVLRYLTDAYRALRQTVPVEARDEEITDIIEWLGELIRQVDSSLLDEWEALSDPGATAAEIVERRFGDDGSRPLTGNPRAFRVMVRNAVHRHVELLARDDIEALVALDERVAEEFPDWDAAIDPYWDLYDSIGTGPDARGPALLRIVTEADSDPRSEPGTWWVRQALDDPAGDHDWAVVAIVDLAESDAAGEVRFRSVAVEGGADRH